MGNKPKTESHYILVLSDWFRFGYRIIRTRDLLTRIRLCDRRLPLLRFQASEVLPLGWWPIVFRASGIHRRHVASRRFALVRSGLSDSHVPDVGHRGNGRVILGSF